MVRVSKKNTDISSFLLKKPIKRLPLMGENLKLSDTFKHHKPKKADPKKGSK
jgi:hypothetical protein